MEMHVGGRKQQYWLYSLDKLIEYGYPNLYYSIKSTHEYIEQHQAEVLTFGNSRFFNHHENTPPHCCEIRGVYQK